MRAASSRRTRGLRAAALVAGTILAAAATGAAAADPAPAAGRFRLSGSASVLVTPPPQRAGPIELRASLSAGAGAGGVRAQSGGSFELLATLTTSSLACYYDTIFRDAFEGSGL